MSSDARVEPRYGVGSALRKYAQFSGRSPRREFWLFTLVVLIGSFVASGIDLALFGFSIEANGPLSIGFGLAVLLPGITVSVRRLHDRGWSGWWVAPYALFSVVSVLATIAEFFGLVSIDSWFIAMFGNLDGLTPTVGIFGVVSFLFAVYIIWLIVTWCRASQEGPNRYGPNPYGDVDVDVF